MARRRLGLGSTIGFVAAFALWLAGCGSVGGGTFVVEHQRASGPLPVVLDDATGTLVSLAAGQQLEGREKFGIDRADGLLPTVEVWWVGRSCDAQVTISLQQVRERYRLEVKVDSAAGCGDVPVSRSVRLTFTDPVTAEMFDVIVPTSVGGRPANPPE